jgi:hypothetical protein
MEKQSEKKKKNNPKNNCEFCCQNGHNKYDCNNEIVLFFVKNVEDKLRYFTFPEIKQYLEKKEMYEIQILMVKNNFFFQCEEREIVDELAKKYDKRNKDRKKKIFRRMIAMKQGKETNEITLNTIFPEIAVQILFLLVKVGIDEEQLFKEIEDLSMEYTEEIKNEIIKAIEYAKECYLTYSFEKAIQLSQIPFPRDWSLEMKMKPFSSERELNRKFNCPICLENRKRVNGLKTECQHFFCKSCLSLYLDQCKKKEPDCPLCRTMILKVETQCYDTYSDFYEKYNDYGISKKMLL